MIGLNVQCTCGVRVSAYAGHLFPKSIFKIIQCEDLHNDTCNMCEIWNHMGWTTGVIQLPLKESRVPKCIYIYFHSRVYIMSECILKMNE